jgi:hypothetical protein
MRPFSRPLSLRCDSCNQDRPTDLSRAMRCNVRRSHRDRQPTAAGKQQDVVDHACGRMSAGAGASCPTRQHRDRFRQRLLLADVPTQEATAAAAALLLLYSCAAQGMSAQQQPLCARWHDVTACVLPASLQPAGAVAASADARPLELADAGARRAPAAVVVPRRRAPRSAAGEQQMQHAQGTAPQRHRFAFQPFRALSADPAAVGRCS